MAGVKEALEQLYILYIFIYIFIYIYNIFIYIYIFIFIYIYIYLYIFNIYLYIYYIYLYYSDIYVLAYHVSKWDPFGSADHCPTQAPPGTLLFATPFTATAPNGTVIWIMSTIGAQIGMVLVSNVQNGISCPMLAAWRRGRELSHVSVALSGKVGPSLGKG